MICIKGWKMTHVVHFERASVDVIDPLVVVRGRNKASKNKGQSNGAGKSLLCFPVPNILRGAPPISAKKKGRKDILGKKSSAYIDFVTHDNKRVEVYQYAGKYQILENGKDLDVKSIPVAEKMVEQYFPLNEQEFYSTVYIRTIPLEFQMGTPSDRLKFLSDLFRLDAYDELRKYFAEKLRAVKDDETRHTLLASHLAKAEQDLKALGWSAKKRDALQESGQRLDGIRAQLRGVVADIHEREIRLINFDNVLDLERQLGDLGYKPAFQVPERLKRAKALLEQVRGHAAHVKAVARYKQAVAKVKADLAEITLPRVGATRINELLDATVKELRKTERRVQELLERELAAEAAERRRASLLKALQRYGYRRPEDVPDGDVAHELAVARTTASLKRLLHTHGDDAKCPTCLSDIDVAAIRSSVRDAERRIEELTAVEECQRIVQSLAEVEAVEFDAGELRAAEEADRKLTEKEERLRADLATIAEHRKLTAILDSIEKPEPVDAPDTSLTEDQLERQISAFHKMATVLKSLERVRQVADIADTSPKAVASARAKLAAEIQELKAVELKLGRRFEALEQEVRGFADGFSQYKMLRKSAVDFQEQLQALEESLDSKQTLEALVSAYGAKGLKIRAITNLCKMLEQNFNVYARYIFNEDFSFRITVEPTGILVDVDRTRGFTSDVRMLSGAESDCFKLLFLTSLLPLMPSDRRVDTLILDEPDSHMDPVSREKFIHDFLPQLQTVVPHIIVISPNSDSYPGAVEWTVEKDKGVSALVT